MQKVIPVSNGAAFLVLIEFRLDKDGPLLGLSGIIDSSEAIVRGDLASFSIGWRRDRGTWVRTAVAISKQPDV